jgi:transposase
LLNSGRGAQGQQRRTRMSRARRNPAPGFTAQVALAAITGDKTLVELAEECDGHPNQLSEGKPQVQESAVVVFGGPKHSKKTVEPDLKVLTRLVREEFT